MEDLPMKNINVLLEKCEVLHIDVRGLTNISYELDKAGFVVLKRLLIAQCGFRACNKPDKAGFVLLNLLGPLLEL